jgi:hypothetical protein
MLSGKFKRHCVKVQVLVTADEQSVHLSKVYRGSSHDKAVFDRSGPSEFLSYLPPGLSAPYQHIIMGDLAYLGITRACPNVLLPHKRLPHGQLTQQQRAKNRVLLRDHILVENFFETMENIIWHLS